MTAYKDLEDNFGLNEEEYKALIEQVQSEVSISETFMRPKWDKWRKRIKLLNNQKRDDTAIGDPLIFPIFQTYIAALYNEEITTTFVPREKGDMDVAENLNALYEYDCVLMDKPRMSYEWKWSAAFFGRSLLYSFEYDTDTMTPAPEVINMMTFYRDPNAKSVNGDRRGRGAMRFGGRPILLTKREMEKSSIYKNTKDIIEGNAVNIELKSTARAIKEANGLYETEASEADGENKQFTVMEWLTWHKGKRVVIGTANGNSEIVRYTVLKDQQKWGIIDMTIFHDPLGWDAVSLVELTEDKQRARARLINAQLNQVETNSNTMYAYDATKIESESDLSFAPNKHIPVEGDPTGVIQPINRSQVSSESQYMIDMMSSLAEKATGASEIQQGALAGSGKTATEIATASQGAATRFALASAVVGWAEKAFARYWYKMYKMHFPDRVGEKVIRLTGLHGALGWRQVNKSDIELKADPDINVTSKVTAEAKKLKELNNFTNSFQMLATHPRVNKELLIERGARLNGWSDTELMFLIPPSPDVIQQRKENETLNENKFVKINQADDDYVHLNELQKAVENKATAAHRKAHLEAIVTKSKNPNIQPEVDKLREASARDNELRAAPVIGQQDFNAPSSLDTAKQK